MIRAGLAGVALEVSDGDPVGGEHNNLVLAQFEGLAGVLDKRCDIRG